MDIDDYEHYIPEEPQEMEPEAEIDILELNKPPVHIHQEKKKPETDFFDLDVLDSETPEIQEIEDPTPSVPKESQCLVRELDMDDFQEWWVDIEGEIEGSVKPCGPKTLSEDLGEFLEEHNIMCMASKDNDDGNQQFYMYAYLGFEDEDVDEPDLNSWVLADINLWSGTKEVEYLLKGFDEQKVKKFEQILIAILKK